VLLYQYTFDVVDDGSLPDGRFIGF